MHTSGTELINPFEVFEHVGIQLGWHVADLGCGALGHFVFPAAQLVGGQGKVYAVDIQRQVLQTVEKSARASQIWNIYPVWADIDVANAVRIPPASLDLTLIANNLYLSQNRAGLVKEALRLTKPGGLVLVIEWKKERTPLGPATDRRLNKDEAKQYFRIPELSFREAFDAGDHHYALLYRRLERDPMTEILSESRPLS